MSLCVRAALDILPLFIGLCIYFLFKDISTYDCVISNCRMIRGRGNGNDIRGEGPGIIKDTI